MTAGIVVLEDNAAARVIQSDLGVQTASICSVLQALHAGGSLTLDEIDVVLADLRGKARPNVAHLRPVQIADGSWARA